MAPRLAEAHYLDVYRSDFTPLETDLPLVIDVDTVLTLAISVDVKPQRACVLSFLDDQLNFDSLPCEALR